MAETPFKLRSGNTPLFKQMGSSPAKHTRRREGHMDKYGAGHTNADHPNYWTKDETTGKTPKSVEVEADTKSKSSETTESTLPKGADKNETKTATTKKKKGNFLQRTLQRFDDAVQSRMKNPRSDWDKEGYESERKQRYADYDEKNKKKSDKTSTSKMKGSPAKKKPEGKPSVQEQKLHHALTSTTSEKTIKEAEDFGNLIKKKIKEYKK